MNLCIRSLTPVFGAEIRGIDLRRPQPMARLDAIYDAFLKYGVLVLPGQALSIAQQLAFARTFGDLWLLPENNVVGVSGQRRIAERAIDDVSNLNTRGDVAGASSEKVMFQLGNQLWHSDLSFRPVPAHASMLHALEVAEEDGETEFADLIGPYEALPDTRKAALEGLIAEHSLSHSRIRGGYGELDAEALKKQVPPSLQPLVRTHPETGRRGLYIGAHASSVVGMPPPEGTALIDELLAFATQAQFTYTHRWAVHDLVIWDNRRVLHRGRPYDADRVRRVMHRATVDGDGPLVVDAVIAPVRVKRRRLQPLQGELPKGSTCP